MEERKVRRFDRGGAWGKRDSIVLVAKESGGMWNNKINLLRIEIFFLSRIIKLNKTLKDRPCPTPSKEAHGGGAY